MNGGGLAGAGSEGKACGVKGATSAAGWIGAEFTGVLTASVAPAGVALEDAVLAPAASLPLNGLKGLALTPVTAAAAKPASSKRLSIVRPIVRAIS
jgi:hypothetical protein